MMTVLPVTFTMPNSDLINNHYLVEIQGEIMHTAESNYGNMSLGILESKEVMT